MASRSSVTANSIVVTDTFMMLPSVLGNLEALVIMGEGSYFFVEGGVLFQSKSPSGSMWFSLAAP